MQTIQFRQAPADVCNHYDKLSTDYRVTKTQVKQTKDGERYYITHTYGKDTWAFKNHQWQIIKS